MPVSRRADEIESWRTQIIGQERRVEENVVQMMAGATMLDERSMLDTYFPQHTARCLDYMSRCSMWDACFVPAVAADPLGSGLYQIRIANHPEKRDSDE
jgi:hypothetical protein